MKGSAGEEYALEVVCSSLGWGADSMCVAGWNKWENEGEQELHTIINDYYSLKESVKPLSSNVSFQWQKENCAHYQNCAFSNTGTYNCVSPSLFSWVNDFS